MIAKMLLRAILTLATPRAVNRLAHVMLTKLEAMAQRTPSRVDDDVVAHLRRLLTTCQHGRNEP